MEIFFAESAVRALARKRRSAKKILPRPLTTARDCAIVKIKRGVGQCARSPPRLSPYLLLVISLLGAAFPTCRARRRRSPPRACLGVGTPLGNTGVLFSRASPLRRYVERSEPVLETVPNLQAKHKENPRSLGGFFILCLGQ